MQVGGHSIFYKYGSIFFCFKLYFYQLLLFINNRKAIHSSTSTIALHTELLNTRENIIRTILDKDSLCHFGQ